MYIRSFLIYILELLKKYYNNTLAMAEEDTKDYWGSFINQNPHSKLKGTEPDYSVLSFIDGLTVASPKKAQPPEKIHPFLQIANQKKTKIGLEVQELISQRHRCKNYSEIHEEQEKKQALKLLDKMTKKPSRRGSRGGDSGIPKRRKAPKERMDSDSDEQSSLHQKRDRKAGPPYMPNVINMDQLYKKASKYSEKGKNKEKQPLSRSRSKRYRKQQARKKLEGSDRENTPEKSGETERKSVQPLIQSVEKPSKNMSSPLDRLQLAFEGSNRSEYLFHSLSTKLTNPQTEPKSIQPPFSQKIEVQTTLHSERARLEQPIPQHPQGQNKLNIPKYQRPKEEEEESQKRISKNKKASDFQKMEKLRQQQNIKAQAEKMKRNLEQLQKELATKKQQLEEKQRRIKQASEKEMFYKQKHSLQQSKKKPHNYKHTSRSRSPAKQDRSWKKQLRKITGYNPHDEKYRNRDRRNIHESGFTQMNNEQAYSRKMGKREEQEEEERYFHKTVKKRNH